VVVVVLQPLTSLFFFSPRNVAVGGTNGWFPDNKGGKMWLDNSQSEFR
jgi:hypothetical protein